MPCCSNWTTGVTRDQVLQSRQTESEPTIWEAPGDTGVGVRGPTRSGHTRRGGRPCSSDTRPRPARISAARSPIPKQRQTSAGRPLPRGQERGSDQPASVALTFLQLLPSVLCDGGRHLLPWVRLPPGVTDGSHRARGARNVPSRSRAHPRRGALADRTCPPKTGVQ